MLDWSNPKTKVTTQPQNVYLANVVENMVELPKLGVHAEED